MAIIFPFPAQLDVAGFLLVRSNAFMSSESHHAIVHFSGRVQGVGFRYTTFQVAQEYDVAGYVQNLPDGRVRIEAEGREDVVADFVAAIEERMAGYIRKTERTGGPRAPQFHGFTIR